MLITVKQGQKLQIAIKNVKNRQSFSLLMAQILPHDALKQELSDLISTERERVGADALTDPAFSEEYALALAGKAPPGLWNGGDRTTNYIASVDNLARLALEANEVMHTAVNLAARTGIANFPIGQAPYFRQKGGDSSTWISNWGTLSSTLHTLDESIGIHRNEEFGPIESTRSVHNTALYLARLGEVGFSLAQNFAWVGASAVAEQFGELGVTVWQLHNERLAWEKNRLGVDVKPLQAPTPYAGSPISPLATAPPTFEKAFLDVTIIFKHKPGGDWVRPYQTPLELTNAIAEEKNELKRGRSDRAVMAGEIGLLTHNNEIMCVYAHYPGSEIDGLGMPELTGKYPQGVTYLAWQFGTDLNWKSTGATSFPAIARSHIVRVPSAFVAATRDRMKVIRGVEEFTYGMDRIVDVTNRLPGAKKDIQPITYSSASVDGVIGGLFLSKAVQPVLA